LRLPAFCGAFKEDKIANKFVDGIRNGILHEAETRRWVIWRNEPKGRIVEPRDDGYALNRTEFYKALKIEFEGYLNDLRHPQNGDRRKRFVKKMDDIIKEV
jgi:NADH:ubiquinone oxidoreductase subunit